MARLDKGRRAYIGVIPGGQVSAPVNYIPLPQGTEHALRRVRSWQQILMEQTHDAD